MADIESILNDDDLFEELCMEKALMKISELKKDVSKLRQHNITYEKRIIELEKENFFVKEEKEILQKEVDSYKEEISKEEISKVRKKFSLGLKTLEHILSIQMSYDNKSGLGFKNASEIKNDFPKVNERLKRRLPI